MSFLEKNKWYLLVQSAVCVLLALLLIAAAIGVCRGGLSAREEDPLAWIFSREIVAQAFHLMKAKNRRHNKRISRFFDKTRRKGCRQDVCGDGIRGPLRVRRKFRPHYSKDFPFVKPL